MKKMFQMREKKAILQVVSKTCQAREFWRARIDRILLIGGQIGASQLLLLQFSAHFANHSGNSVFHIQSSRRLNSTAESSNHFNSRGNNET